MRNELYEQRLEMREVELARFHHSETELDRDAMKVIRDTELAMVSSVAQAKLDELSAVRRLEFQAQTGPEDLANGDDLLDVDLYGVAPPSGRRKAMSSRAQPHRAQSFAPDRLAECPVHPS